HGAGPHALSSRRAASTEPGNFPPHPALYLSRPLEVDIMVKLSAFLVMGAVLCLPAYVQAQSPIPDTRVPGFGGPNNGGGPANFGSDVGSNVGAGATASPVPDPTPPGVSPSIAEVPLPRPLIGASRNLPLVKPPTPTK